MSTSNAIDDYASLLLKLHALIRDGSEDSPEADQIRDAMDRPWYGLSDAEQELIRGLSIDLYDQDSTFATHSIDLTSESDGANAFEDAKNARDWIRALAVLRDCKDDLPGEALASLRGIVWSNLGFHDVASVFFKRAAELNSFDPTYETLFLQHELASDHCRLVEPRAREIADTRHMDPSRLLVAGMILFAVADLDQSSEGLERAIRTTLRGIRSARITSLPPSMGFLLARSYRLVGMYYHLIGQLADARRAYERAIDIDHDDSIANELLTRLIQDSTTPLTRNDFRDYARRSREEPIPEMPLAA